MKPSRGRYSHLGVNGQERAEIHGDGWATQVVENLNKKLSGDRMGTFLVMSIHS